MSLSSALVAPPAGRLDVASPEISAIPLPNFTKVACETGPVEQLVAPETSAEEVETQEAYSEEAYAEFLLDEGLSAEAVQFALGSLPSGLLDARGREAHPGGPCASTVASGFLSPSPAPLAKTEAKDEEFEDELEEPAHSPSVNEACGTSTSPCGPLVAEDLSLDPLRELPKVRDKAGNRGLMAEEVALSEASSGGRSSRGNRFNRTSGK